jgi:hypothetical protein
MLHGILETLRAHKDELLVLTSLCAVAVSLVSTFFGPAIQMRVARLNARTATLVTARIKWIETIQADIANLMALTEQAEFLRKSMDEIHKKYPTLSPPQQDEFNRMHQAHEEKTLQRNTLANLISIKLDVSQQLRARLFTAINTFALQTPGMTTANAKTDAVMLEIHSITQELLRSEWSRVERELGRN